MARKASRKGRSRKGGKPPRAAKPRASDEPRPSPANRKDEAPKGPWGPFPVTELSILAGLVLIVIGMISGNTTQLLIGLLLGSAGGLELAIREHFSGYRSHTTLLAGVVTVATIVVTYYMAGLVFWLALAIGLTFFGVSFGLMRRSFQKASGGLSYRVR